MASKLTTDYFIDLGDLGEQEVRVGYTYAPGDPGRISGPPENCWPPEGAEYEIISLSFGDKPVTGKLADLITDWLLESDNFAEHLGEIYEDSCNPCED